MKHHATIVCAALLAACTPITECMHQPVATNDQFDACDPIKPVNEQVFRFNLVTDRWVFAPVTHAYQEVPIEGRMTIDNFLTNLGEPSNSLNSFLQGDMQAAGTSLWRFILNSTFGFAGLRDFAGENGLLYNDQDFGKTLGSYGVSEGAYVVLPFYGPSTVRDTAGKAVDWFLDPVGWHLNTPESIAQDVAEAIDTRDENDSIVTELYYESINPYAATRASYLQHQAKPKQQAPALFEEHEQSEEPDPMPFTQ